MGRAPRKLHELKPVERRGTAAVYYRQKWITLGKWDAKRGEPSPEAAAKLDSLRALWRVDPEYGADKVSDLRLAELWVAWLESPERPRTSADNRRRVSRYLFGTADEPGPYLEATVNGFGARELQNWQACLCGLTDENGRARLSRETIARAVKLVVGCYAWGVVRGSVDHLHAASLSLVAPPARGAVRENGKRKPVARSAVEVVLPALSPPLRAASELIWLTCSRPSEVLGLRAGDIQRGGQVLTPGGVVLDLDALGVWCAILGEHKTDDTDFERVVFFGPRSRAILSPFLDGCPSTSAIFRPADGVAHGLRKSGASPKARGQAVNEFYHSHALERAVRRACKRLGVPHWSPYQLRHSAFRLVQAEFGRDAARVFGGHKVGGATENYAGADLKTAAKVAAAMG
jgi:integrase